MRSPELGLAWAQDLGAPAGGETLPAAGSLLKVSEAPQAFAYGAWPD